MTVKSGNHSLAKFIALIIIIAFLYIVNSNGNTIVPDRPLTKAEKKALQKKKIGIKGVSNIPERIYKNTLTSDNLAGFLTSRQKIIYYAYLENCTESNAFLADLESMMSKYPELKYIYRYYPSPQEHTTLVTCNKAGTNDCVENYLIQNCSENLCIINPTKKQLVKIAATDPKIAFERIYKYKNW